MNYLHKPYYTIAIQIESNSKVLLNRWPKHDNHIILHFAESGLSVFSLLKHNVTGPQFPWNFIYIFLRYVDSFHTKMVSWQKLKHGKIAYKIFMNTKKVSEKSRECHNHKPQPFPDTKRKRKPTNLNKHKPNKRTKSTKITSLFPKRGNRNTKRTEKHKNKMTHGKTYKNSPRRINHRATKSKTNTGTTALEWSVEQKK